MRANNAPFRQNSALCVFSFVRPVFKFVYLRSEVEKSDTFLHIIHSGPFDQYINMRKTKIFKYVSAVSMVFLFRGILILYNLEEAQSTLR